MRNISMVGVFAVSAILAGCGSAAPTPDEKVLPGAALAVAHGAVGTQLNQGKFAVVRKATAPGCVVYARFTGVQNIGPKIAQASGWASKKGYSLIGPPACIYQLDFPSAPDKSVIELQLPIAQFADEQGGEVGVKWDYSLEVLSTYHRGSYETIGQSYDFLMGIAHEKQLGGVHRKIVALVTRPAG